MTLIRAPPTPFPRLPRLTLFASHLNALHECSTSAGMRPRVESSYPLCAHFMTSRVADGSRCGRSLATSPVRRWRRPPACGVDDVAVEQCAECLGVLRVQVDAVADILNTEGDEVGEDLGVAAASGDCPGSGKVAPTGCPTVASGSCFAMIGRSVDSVSNSMWPRGLAPASSY